MKVYVVFYSMYGHIYRMAEAIAEGVKEVKGTEVVLRRVPETLPPYSRASLFRISRQNPPLGTPTW